MKYPKKKIMMNKYNFLIAFFIVLTSFSQNYKGTLSVIEEDGLHKIIVPQEVRSSCNENFNFLRIKDVQKNEVPYVLIYNNDKKFSTFKPIKIASKKDESKRLYKIHTKWKCGFFFYYGCCRNRKSNQTSHF